MGPLMMVVEGVTFLRAGPGIYRTSSMSGDRGTCVKTLKSLPSGRWSVELEYIDGGGTFSGSGATREVAFRKAALAAWKQ